MTNDSRESSFSIEENREFDEGEFSSPEEIANFSVDSDGQVHCDDRQKKYILSTSNLDHLHIEMPDDFVSKAPKYPNADKRLGFFLQWLLLNFDTISRYLDDKAFICHRGLLTLLSKSFYGREDFLICASKFKGIIYMTTFDTEPYKNFKENSPATGFHLYKYFTSAFTVGRDGKDTEVSEMGKFEAVFRRKMKDSTLFYCAEIEAVNKTNGEANSRDDYLKMIPIKCERFENPSKFNALNRWTQCYWSGIKYVVYGVTKDNVITRTDVVPTEQLLEITKLLWEDPKLDSNGDNSCEKFLAFIQSVVVKDDPNVVYEFSHKRFSSQISVKEIENPEERRVLPEWYVKKFEDISRLSYI